MPFRPRQYAPPEPSSPAPVTRVARSVGGLGTGVTVVALVIATALTGGLAWNLFTTQSRARESVRDTTVRRAALTADLIGSAFLASSTSEEALAELAGPPRELRKAVAAIGAASSGQQVTVLDARGRLLAAAGPGGGPDRSHRREVRAALKGRAALSDAFLDARRRWAVQIAVPFPTRSGRWVLLASAPVDLVQTFTQGFFSTASPFPGTQGYLIDGTGRILVSGDSNPDAVPTRAPGRRSRRASPAPMASGRSCRGPGRHPAGGSCSAFPTQCCTRRSGPRSSRGVVAVRRVCRGALRADGSRLHGGAAARKLTDANARERAATELAHERLHDWLTGLPNRALFATRAEHAVERPAGTGGPSSWCSWTSITTSSINDSLGHEVGDEVLREVARRLSRQRA